MPRRSSPRLELLERLAALAACLAAALLALAGVLRREVVEGDALVHQYWMARFADPALFTDPLTAALRESERYPDGYEALFRLAAPVADPVAFGEVLGIVLMGLAGFLVFLVVREHTAWRPAAWIAAAVFLALDGHRFNGGFPRAFLHVVVLATVLLALRGHVVAAALAAAGGALVYPPAALLAVGVLAVAALRVERGRPRVLRSQARVAALAVLLAGAVLAATQLGAGGTTDVLTAAEARAYPEFGPQGGLHFFVPSTLEYLRQNRSGFDLRATGSALALVAFALLLARPAAARLLRPEVLALPVVALAGWAVAQAVLFRLYLPHRYTYPLLAFLAIAVGVTLLPAWRALLARTHPRRWAFAALLAPLPLAAAGLVAFPLGPLERPSLLLSAPAIAAAGAAVAAAAVAAAVLARRPAPVAAAAGAALTGLVLVGALLAMPGRTPPGQACRERPVVRFIATLPKDAVLAGDPIDLRCLPVSARRAVVISTQLAPSYEAGYFLAARARMFATLRAYYGSSPDALAAVAERYGATHLLVRREALRRELAHPGVRWRPRRLPYGRYVRARLEEGTPATLRLPERCVRYRHGAEAVYALACVTARASRARQATGTAWRYRAGTRRARRTAGEGAGRAGSGACRAAARDDCTSASASS